MATLTMTLDSDLEDQNLPTAITNKKKDKQAKGNKKQAPPQIPEGEEDIVLSKSFVMQDQTDAK